MILPTIRSTLCFNTEIIQFVFINIYDLLFGLHIYVITYNTPKTMIRYQLSFNNYIYIAIFTILILNLP